MNDNGSGPTSRPSPVPLVRLRGNPAPANRYILELEDLKARAARDGFGTLAYILEMAHLEAQRLVGQEERDDEEELADPRDLWRPDAR